MLEDGDWLILVTDGVLDALPGVDKEETLKEIILKNGSRNPRDYAEKILKAVRSGQENVKDDMTVLAAGIWTK